MRSQSITIRAAFCPYCFSDKLEWKQASGKGKIYTFSVMRRAPEPYVIAYVTLDEGVSMMTNIVDCDFDKVKSSSPSKSSSRRARTASRCRCSRRLRSLLGARHGVAHLARRFPVQKT